MPTHTRTLNKGFTIVESLVAITILVLAITGATSALQVGLSSYIFSKDQIIAFYLAQEGVEQIRNIRDENALAGRDWLTSLSAASDDPCYFGKVCLVDTLISDVPERCGDNPGSCPFLRQDSESGFFGYDSSWDETIFKREIILEQIGADEISILVRVEWSKGLVEREFRARENIFNWQ